MCTLIKTVPFFSREVPSDQEAFRCGPHVQVEGLSPGCHPVLHAVPFARPALASRRHHRIRVRRGREPRPDAR